MTNPSPAPPKVQPHRMMSIQELEIAELKRQNELMRMNLCPHALRYGRTCDEGPTDKEIEEFLKK